MTVLQVQDKQTKKKQSRQHRLSVNAPWSPHLPKGIDNSELIFDNFYPGPFTILVVHRKKLASWMLQGGTQRKPENTTLEFEMQHDAAGATAVSTGF